WLAELKSDASTARMRAANIVGKHAAEAKQAIPDLIKLLDDQAPLVRWMAAEALGKFGADARDAAPALRKLAAQDPEATVRAAAPGPGTPRPRRGRRAATTKGVGGATTGPRGPPAAGRLRPYGFPPRAPRRRHFSCSACVASWNGLSRSAASHALSAAPCQAT